MAETVKAIGDLLATQGGWGLAALFGYVIWKLYDGKCKEQEKQHTEFVSLLRETQDALTSIGIIIQKCQKEDETND